MNNKITIITPCLNALELLKETVCSVLQQKACLNGQVEFEYIICDGGSQDGTIEWIESIESSNIRLISEPDTGVYDALSKGLNSVSGDFIAYLNAGDYYSRNAFNILMDVFSDPDVKWVTGYNTWYNQKGYLVKALLPYRYRRSLIQAGVYGYLMPWMWIQQESTFWRAELLSSVDMRRLSQFKFSGDYYLWHQFSKVSDLHIVKAHMGGFRKHFRQISEDKKQYQKEMSDILERSPSVYDYMMGFIDTIVWYMPDRIKCTLNRRIIKL